MSDEYKVLENYSKYRIYDDGRIYSLIYNKFIKSHNDLNGYMKINLSNDEDKSKRLSVHRMVALTFIDNPNNKPEVDHINRNRSDNRVSNLRWSDRIEQNSNQIRPEDIRGRSISRIDNDGVISSYKSINLAVKDNDITYYTLNRCLRNKESYNSYQWVYNDLSDNIKYGTEWRLCTFDKCEKLEASDLGFIRLKNKILNMGINGGYNYIGLNSKNIMVHILVASAFIGLRPEGLVIDHIDNNRLNNKPTNLQYVTPRENALRVAKFNKGIAKAVQLIDTKTDDIEYFYSLRQIENIYGFTPDITNHLCKHSILSHDRYYFIKEEDIVPITRYNVKKDTYRVYKSIIIASKSTGISVYDIKVSCLTAKIINGYRFLPEDYSDQLE